MNKLKFLFASLFLGTMAFGQTAVNNFENILVADNSGYATIHIYRPKATYGVIWNYNIKVNGEKVKMKNGSYCTVKVKPGESKLQVLDIGKCEMTFEVESGKDYYVQTYLRRSVFMAVPEIAEVTPRFAKGQIEKLKD